MSSFFSSILAVIMSFFSIFGGIFGGFSGGGEPDPGDRLGFISEAQASEAYQNGSWNGSRAGLYEVRDGLLYVGNKVSNYPADSSLAFPRKVIVSVPGKYTVFEYDPGVSVYNLDWDFRGENLYKMRFAEFLKNSTSHTTELSADGQTIILKAEYPGSRKTLFIPVDYEAAINQTTTTTT